MSPLSTAVLVSLFVLLRIADASPKPQGGSSGPQVYQPSGAFSQWSHIGCFQDGNPRTLSVGVNMNGDNTPENCIAECQSRGYSFAGVEYT